MLEEKQTAMENQKNPLIWFILKILSVLPFVVIGLPLWLTFILLVLCSFLPFVSPVFWIWGLISAILGPQDVLSIIYYIVFAVVYCPFFFSFFVPWFVQWIRHKRIF